MSSDANLSQAELKAYSINKARFFKGTIAVCAVYGAFAALLLGVALFDARGRQILTTDLLPFVITFAASMILIIILLVVQVVTFKPKRLQQGIYDGDMCPDYWILKERPANEAFPAGATETDQQLMKYRCEPDPAVFNMGLRWEGINLTDVPTDSAASLTNTFGHSLTVDANNKIRPYKTIDGNSELSNASDKMYATTDAMGTGRAYCDQVYPAFLANADASKTSGDPNKLRCDYANTCGISWTAACPAQDT
jgi:hypothetical protein